MLRSLAFALQSLVACSWLLVAPCNAQNDCVDVQFNLLLDNNPEQVGWSLICDEETVVWQVPPGQFSQDLAGTWSQQEACIDYQSISKCLFIMLDTAGDGLTEQGWFSLNLGAATIATYNDGGAFHQLDYCFGPACSTEPAEVAEEQNECKPLFFELMADTNPQQIGFQLRCDNVTIWDVEGLSEPMEVVSLEECISPIVCCTITILDSGNDGLSDSNGPGYIALEFDYEDKMNIQGPDLQFGMLSLSFGHMCNGQ